jgi:hypothetical protein
MREEEGLQKVRWLRSNKETGNKVSESIEKKAVRRFK